MHWWITDDDRRLYSRISSRMEVDVLVGCLRAFGYLEVADDLLNEFVHHHLGALRNEGFIRVAHASRN